MTPAGVSGVDVCLRCLVREVNHSGGFLCTPCLVAELEYNRPKPRPHVTGGLPVDKEVFKLRYKADTRRSFTDHFNTWDRVEKRMAAEIKKGGSVSYLAWFVFAGELEVPEQ